MDNSCLNRYCETLREQYPEYISLNQLYRICRISKRSASYLVINKIIPSIDTGKKTWRYGIAMDDVITYLKTPEKVGDLSLVGTSNTKRVSPMVMRKLYAEYIKQFGNKRLFEYFEYLYADCPDVMGLTEASEISGLGVATIYRHIKSGDIQIFRISNSYMIPKQNFINYLASQKFIGTKSPSAFIQRLLQGFELWMTKHTSINQGEENQKNEWL